jgi:GntR family transcriptional regulator/MocR family aminotransferase
MFAQLIKIDKTAHANLKDQIKQSISVAILDELILTDKPLPSSRKLATALKVSRQTVMFAFENLVDEGYLIARERKGYFVNPDILKGRVVASTQKPINLNSRPKWQELFTKNLSKQVNIKKPANWQQYPYPFTSGQIDPKTFPIAEWRECSKQALSVLAVNDWTGDTQDADDPELIEQIQSRVLPRRGIWAKSEEILITVGTQNSLYLLSSLLSGNGRKIAMENPGYLDARNIFNTHFDDVILQPIDKNGLVVNQNLCQADYVYVTPSHHWPTSVTMPIERREKLLAKAQDEDLIIIEDDYEIETNYLEEPLAALKSLDTNDRVIYVSSLSKFLAPGLRIGFMVGSKELIDEARVLRRLMMRHPPLNNQRMTALFLSRGHYEALIKRLCRIYKNKWLIITEAIRKYIPSNESLPVNGGTSCWIRGPQNLDCHELQALAKENGILIELGDVAFGQKNPPKNYFRLGLTIIPEHKIEPGVKKLGELIQKLTYKY